MHNSYSNKYMLDLPLLLLGFSLSMHSMQCFLRRNCPKKAVRIRRSSWLSLRFRMNVQACFMKPGQHIQLKKDYYTHFRWNPSLWTFLVLYLLFWMSVQDWAACNLYLATAGRLRTNLWEVSWHCIKKKALLPITWAHFMPFSFVLYALYHYHLLLYALFQK